MRRLTALIIALSAVATATAQGKLTLKFPDEGQRRVWVSSAHPDALPATAETAAAKSFTIGVPSAAGNSRVFVWDEGTNRIATVALASLKASEWVVEPTDYTLLGIVRVRMVHEGKPLQTANVTLKDAKRSTEQLLDVSSKGTAEFFAINPGSVRVTATYRSEGSTKTANETHSVKLEDSSPTPVLVLSVPDPVATIGEDKEGEAATPPEAERPPLSQAAGSVLGNIAMYVITIIVGIAIIYGLYRLLQMKQTEKVIGQGLEKLGVVVGDPSPSDPAHPVAAPKAPEPPQKIILDDAVPADAAPIPLATIATGIPRLVRETGEVVELPEGLHVLGREDGLPIAVADPSISRRHAQIVCAGNEITVSDLGSTNGTFVNGVRVDGDQVLRPGDTLQVGTVRMRVEA